jgi:Integrin beta chain VWA domain
VANRLRVARLDSSPYRSLAETPPDAALHRRLESAIRQHLPPVTASILAQPSADGRIVEWYTDLAGQPQPLGALRKDEQNNVRALLEDRLRSIGALADRLASTGTANQQLADELRQAVSYPGDETVYVVAGQPILTFWGYRSATVPLPVAEEMPTAAAPVDALPEVPPNPASGRPSRRWLWGALALALILLIAGAIFDTGFMRWPPWGPDYKALLETAMADEDRLNRRLAELREALSDAVDRCELNDALAAAIAEGERLDGVVDMLSDILQETLSLCALRAELQQEVDAGAKLNDRMIELSKNLENKIKDCEKKEAALSKIPEELRCLADGPVDIYFLQDLTGSLSDDLPNMQKFMRDMISRIRRGDFGSDVHLGLGSFTDKPVYPFGERNHYVFKNHLSLTTDFGRLEQALRSLRVLEGGDGPEAQYEAILEMVAQARQIGFRAPARKFVVLLTDAEPHVAGDWARRSGRRPVKPNDGRGDGDPLDEDYPSVEQVNRALQSADVTPIFLVADRALNTYRAAVNASGRGAAMRLSGDSSNVMDVLLAGLKKTCEQK